MKIKNIESQRINFSPEEIELMLSVPAIFVDNFYISVGAPTVRITFAEASSSPLAPQPRTAVSMTMHNAKQLRDLLTSLLSDTEEVSALD